MPYICPSTRAKLISDKQTLEAQLTKANQALLDTLNSEIESYTFDSAEARQQAKLRDPEKLQKTIDWIESRINSIDSRLRGTGVVNMNMRRKGYCGY